LAKKNGLMTTEPMNVILGPDSIFPVVGEVALRRMVAEFYRQVPDDSILGPMYPPNELPAAEKRLADFLIYRFGGPDTYIQERGNPKLRIRHAPFDVTHEARNRWVALMDTAIQRSQIPERAVQPIRTFLAEVATFLINRT